MPEIVDKVLGRAFSVESRMMLTAHIEEKTGQVVSREYYALNEFGLFRRYMGGVASVVVRYQNQVVGMYDCDGVMVATPTRLNCVLPFCRRARSRSPGAVHADYPCMRSIRSMPGHLWCRITAWITLAAPTTRQGVNGGGGRCVSYAG